MSTVLTLPPRTAAAPVAALPPIIPDRQPFGGLASMRKFTVDEYHRMIDAGILTDDDSVELLEGFLVIKMPRSPAHDFAIRSLNKRLGRLVPDDYLLSNQCATTFDASEPEPDFTVARGEESSTACGTRSLMKPYWSWKSQRRRWCETVVTKRAFTPVPQYRITGS